jgi:hypothetical protein
MPLSLLPDDVELTRQAALAQTALTAYVGTRMYDRVPATPTWPLIVFISVDDNEAGEPTRGSSRVQADVWGRSGSPTDTAEAKTIARTLRAVARDFKGTYGGVGTVSSASAAFIVPQPDPTTGRARFVVDILLETSP